MNITSTEFPAQNYTETEGYTGNVGKLIEGEVTYPIIGLIFQVFKELGYGFQERYYQRAFEEILKANKVSYRKEVPVAIRIEGKVIGRYYVDFIIEDQVVVEWKIAQEFYTSHINQVLAYLRSTKLQIGIIARVTESGVKIKRLVV